MPRRFIRLLSGPSYPDVEPYESGLLDTGDGNRVYWETCGNPDGVPVLIVHGGPGSGCTFANRRAFDPERRQLQQLYGCREDRLRAHLRALLLT